MERCRDVGNDDGTGWQHHCVLTATSQVTFYQCGDAADGFSSVFQVQVALAAGDPSPFTFLSSGDMGVTNADDTLRTMGSLQNSSSFIWHLGDQSYSDDRLESSYEITWNQFMNRLQPLASSLPFMTLPGNHEATCNEIIPTLCSDMHKNFTAYRARFNMPSLPSGGVDNMWYSFDYGLVHFVSISTETDFPGAPEGPGSYLNAGPFGDQMGWLERDLAAAVANRARVPWILVGGHRPVYSTGGEADAMTALRAWLEPVFAKYQVDMYLCGHVHWYERLYPVAKGIPVQKDYINPSSPVYLINGAAGNIEGHSWGGSGADYLAYLNQVDYGVAQLTVHNHTHLSWQWFRASDGQVVDTFVLVQEGRR